MKTKLLIFFAVAACIVVAQSPPSYISAWWSQTDPPGSDVPNLPSSTNPHYLWVKVPQPLGLAPDSTGRMSLTLQPIPGPIGLPGTPGATGPIGPAGPQKCPGTGIGIALVQAAGQDCFITIDTLVVPHLVDPPTSESDIPPDISSIAKDKDYEYEPKPDGNGGLMWTRKPWPAW